MTALTKKILPLYIYLNGSEMLMTEISRVMIGTIEGSFGQLGFRK
jgi:hypothetical protein